MKEMNCQNSKEEEVQKMAVVQQTFDLLTDQKCSICKLSEIDSLNYGEIHSNKELAVHLFCLECCYCNGKSATTYCHYPNCGRVFHQVCGFKANARFEFLGQFKSFCDTHNSIENENLKHPEAVGCWICYEPPSDYHPVTTVPSCCGEWLHQQCLRKYAINAGYAFMCPLCRNKDYGDFARLHGIFVPEYEALWEKTHDYADIERFYTHCDATKCICPNGRTYTNHKWDLQLCSCCGSFGFHKLCRPASEREDIIICEICVSVAPTNQTNDPNSQQTDQNLNEQRETEAGAVMIDKILDENIASRNRKSETLDEKREREKAERPIRNEMSDFRIGLWFRDYERYYKSNK